MVTDCSPRHPPRLSKDRKQPPPNTFAPTQTLPCQRSFCQSLINYDDFWLTPCGFWKGPTNVTKRLDYLKLSFHAKAPPNEFLNHNFTTIIQNAKILMDETTIGGEKSTGFLVTTKEGENPIRLRHVVFEV